MEIKLFKLTNNIKELTPFDRPFYKVGNTIKLVDNPSDADYILLSPNQHEYKLQIEKYKKFNNKMVVWVNNDNPDFLKDEDGVPHKLIAQPSGKKLNHITVPLVMTDHHKWHFDNDFLQKCRNQDKIYDYCFMGQIYGNRNKLKELNLDNYLLKKTGSIYGMNDDNKHRSIESYLMELGKCKFTFAPRGTGSNSFRLYESLMVGTVPIATDVIEYPFESEVKWDEFTIRGKMNNIEELVDISKSIDFNSFRKRGIDFWENYVKMDNMHSKILKLL